MFILGSKFSDFILRLLLTIIAIDAYPYSPCTQCVMRAGPEELANMSLRLYPNETLEDFVSVFVSNASDLCEKIDPEKPTMIYIFGWSETPNSKSVETILNAYLKIKNHNVILVDWYVIGEKNYPYVVASVNGIGFTLAKGLEYLVKACLNPSKLHIVGHSMGGQIAGYIGKHANFKPARITGLDPAGPGFNYMVESLSANDALFVDVIHTDDNFYGNKKCLGDVNFYPNGGKRFQPGCPKLRIILGDEDFCDHHKSWYFYAESVTNKNAFIGVQCESYEAFKSDSCSFNKRVTMGCHTPTSAKGNFYLQTNGEFPYGRGEDGLNFTLPDYSISSMLDDPLKLFSLD